MSRLRSTLPIARLLLESPELSECYSTVARSSAGRGSRGRGRGRPQSRDGPVPPAAPGTSSSSLPSSSSALRSSSPSSSRHSTPSKSKSKSRYNEEEDFDYLDDKFSETDDSASKHRLTVDKLNKLIQQHPPPHHSSSHEPTVVFQDLDNPNTKYTVTASQIAADFGDQLIHPMAHAMIPYLIKPKDYLKYVKGKMKKRELNDFLEKLDLLINPELSNPRSIFENKKLQYDPSYALMSGESTGLLSAVHSSSSRSGNRKHSASTALKHLQPPSPEDFDRLKKLGCIVFGQTEAEAEKLKEPVLALVAKDIQKLKKELKARDACTEEEELLNFMKRHIPEDLPFKQSLEAKIKTIIGNPGWPHHEKIVAASKLIKTMVAAAAGSGGGGGGVEEERKQQQ